MSTVLISPRRAAAVVAAAGVIAVAAFGLSASVSTAGAAVAGSSTETVKAASFQAAMRALWQAHGTYTERAIVDFVGGLPDTKLVVGRLLRNQVDIGNAVKPYYGAKGGAALTKLLKAHINDAVAVLAAAKAGNASKVAKAKARFYANGNQIASFLHTANPKYWPLGAMRKMMRIHLNQVIGLAVDQLKGHYAAAIRLYDVYINHILVGMADMLSSGIIQQFPARFS
ncbi:MAG: hypothetical protein ACRDLM_04015 [Gaiellaceae bacterium]